MENGTNFFHLNSGPRDRVMPMHNCETWVGSRTCWARVTGVNSRNGRRERVTRYIPLVVHLKSRNYFAAPANPASGMHTRVCRVRAFACLAFAMF